MRTEVHVFLMVIFLASFLPIVLAITGEVITGEATQSDMHISINVTNGLVISILHPLNTTYTFGEGVTVFPLDLNVSADSVAESWWYTLTTGSGVVINESVLFTPNTTIYAVLGSNRLFVYANNSAGVEASQSVVFSVRGENAPPVLGSMDSELFLCEGNITVYPFNATDSEGGSLEVDISPKDPFFVFPTQFQELTSIQSNIISLRFGKGNIGLHEETVSVSDGEYSDSKVINITVIEINNYPVVETLGAKTVWSRGENSTFYEVVGVSDTENGAESSGNFSFNLTFLNGISPFFNISRFGIMNFTANESFLGSNNGSVVYNLSLCVTDLALDSPHANISLCGQDGSNQTVCQNFSLTVTAQNRAPSITSHTPSSFNFSVVGTDSITFLVNTIDPDGTSPDAFWYVDNVLKERDTGSLQDSFTYSPGCGVSGTYNISVDVSDGEMNDSLQWNVTVEFVACPTLSPGAGGSSGGGGGGSGEVCMELWACGDWMSCANLQEALNLGNILGEDYRDIFGNCSTNGWESLCGFQTRHCVEVSDCNTTYNKPSEQQACYFVAEPSCFDGIKNCHDGQCEFLVDCGGPCSSCPTCSDGIQNQGEEGIDCGGPCPSFCITEQLMQSPLQRLSNTFLQLLTGESKPIVYISMTILFVLSVILIFKLWRIISLRKRGKINSLSVGENL